MTIGIFGGTFNPIHIGHLVIAQEVGRQLHFSKVLFVPAKIPPHKAHLGASEQERYEMVELAISDNPFFRASRVELDRDKISYTIDTIEILKKECGERLAFIIGSDNLLEITKWHRWITLLEECELAIGERPGFGPEVIGQIESLVGRELAMHFERNFVKIPFANISSSEIRERYAQGIPVKYLVPDVVDRYIVAHRLYSLASDGA